MGKTRWVITAETVRCANGKKRSLKSLHGLSRAKISALTGIPLGTLPRLAQMHRIEPLAVRGRLYKVPPKDEKKREAWIKNHPVWARKAGLA
jgi:hypothetical protein